jgi:hypothetical protein
LTFGKVGGEGGESGQEQDRHTIHTLYVKGSCRLPPHLHTAKHSGCIGKKRHRWESTEAREFTTHSSGVLCGHYSSAV